MVDIRTRTTDISSAAMSSDDDMINTTQQTKNTQIMG